MIEFLKKYQTQIFNVITIFLILQFAIFPGLTAANTIMNILAGIGLLLLVLWGGLALYNYIRSSEGGLVDINELKEAEQMVKEKPKTKRKPKSVVKIDFTDAKGMNEIDGVIKPIAEGRVKVSVQTPKVMGEYQLNNKEKVRKSLTKNKK
jgi:hypothetical protein